MNSFRLLALATAAVVALTSYASAYDRRVRVHNDSGYDIHYLYMSNKGSKSWEEDVLGPNDILSTGRTVIVDVDDGSGYCVYDFKAVFEDGDTAEKFGVNVCEVSDFYFN